MFVYRKRALSGAKCAQFNYLQRKLLVEKLIQRNSFLSPSWKPINGACISTGMKK